MVRVAQPDTGDDAGTLLRSGLGLTLAILWSLMHSCASPRLVVWKATAPPEFWGGPGGAVTAFRPF